MIQQGNSKLRYKNRRIYEPPPKEDYTTNFKKLIAVIIISFIFIAGEFVGGIISGSISVISDAFHLVTDLLGFVVSFVFIWFSRKRPNEIMSFGYHRMELMGALGNLFIIWGLAIFLIYEATLRIIHKQFVKEPLAMLIVAAAGLPINIIMYFVLHSGGSHSHGLMSQSCGQQFPLQQTRTKSSKAAELCSEVLCQDIQCLISNEYEDHCHKLEGDSQSIHKHRNKVLVEGDKIIRKSSKDIITGQSKNQQHNHNHDQEHEHDHDHSNCKIHDHTQSQEKNEREQKNYQNESNNHNHDHKDGSKCSGNHDHNHKHDQNPNNNHEDQQQVNQNKKKKKNKGKKKNKVKNQNQFEGTQEQIQPNHNHGHGHNHDDHEHQHQQSNGHGHQHGGGCSHGHGHGHGHGHSQQHGHSHESMSMKAAVLHALSDVIQSIGLLISSLIIFFAGSDMGKQVLQWNDVHYLDPISTYIFSVIVLVSTVPVAKNCYQIIMESTPPYLSYNQIRDEIAHMEGVLEVHDLHIWDLRPGKTILISHVFSRSGQQRKVLKRLTDLSRRKKIYHSTFQVEEEDWRHHEEYILCDHDIH